MLFGGPIESAEERFLQTFLNPLWDLGLTIGHHVREVREGANLEADNHEFLLALTDARPIIGDAVLLDQFFEASDKAKTATRTRARLAAASGQPSMHLSMFQGCPSPSRSSPRTAARSS